MTKSHVQTGGVKRKSDHFLDAKPGVFPPPVSFPNQNYEETNITAMTLELQLYSVAFKL